MELSIPLRAAIVLGVLLLVLPRLLVSNPAVVVGAGMLGLALGAGALVLGHRRATRHPQEERERRSDRDPTG